MRVDRCATQACAIIYKPRTCMSAARVPRCAFLPRPSRERAEQLLAIARECRAYVNFVERVCCMAAAGSFNAAMKTELHACVCARALPHAYK